MKIKNETASKIIKATKWIQNADMINDKNEKVNINELEYEPAMKQKAYGFCIAGAIQQATCNQFLNQKSVQESLKDNWDDTVLMLHEWLYTNRAKLEKPFTKLTEIIMQKACKEKNVELLTTFYQITKEARQAYRKTTNLKEKEQFIKEMVNRKIITTWNDQDSRTEKEIIEILESINQ